MAILAEKWSKAFYLLTFTYYHYIMSVHRYIIITFRLAILVFNTPNNLPRQMMAILTWMSFKLLYCSKSDIKLYIYLLTLRQLPPHIYYTL